MTANDTDLSSPGKNEHQQSSRTVLLSGAAFVGSLIEGACAILVASASAKLFVGLGAAALAVKASRLHADVIRIPVLLIAAASASLTLFVLWNGWRARHQSAARWRKRPMTTRERLSFAITLTGSVLTLILVIGEAVVHPIFRAH